MNYPYKILNTRYRASSHQHRASRIKHPGSLIPHPATRNSQPATHSPHPATGFTLIEILLAFLILAIVLTTLMTSFNAVFSTTDALENSSKYYDMAKNCLNRMILDLDAVYVPQPPF